MSNTAPNAMCVDVFEDIPQDVCTETRLDLARIHPVFASMYAGRDKRLC